MNALTYKGEISPKKDDKDWQHLYFIESSGEKGADNSNKKEAEDIKEYIVSQKEFFKDILIRASGGKKIEISDTEYFESIGIITPFANQEREIRSTLNQLKHKYPCIEKVEVGTVHKYQGSEREIIIFSTVYGKNMKKRAVQISFLTETIRT